MTSTPFVPPHNSVVVIWRMRDGEPEVLLLKCIPLHFSPRHHRAKKDHQYRAPRYPESVVFYVPPGGKAEPGESPEDTARRETKEETGYKLRTKIKLEKIYEHGREGVHVKYGFLFDGHELRGKKRKAPVVETARQIVGIQWMRLSVALRLIGPGRHEDSHHEILQAAKEEIDEILKEREGGEKDRRAA